MYVDLRKLKEYWVRTQKLSLTEWDSGQRNDILSRIFGHSSEMTFDI